MHDETTDHLALLMAPHRLPACFSVEEIRIRALPIPAPAAPRLRLGDVASALRQHFALRAAASRNVSAAAW